MGIKFANSAFATLAAGINSSATSITLTTGQGARFPSLAGGDYFFATLIDTSNNLEIVKCTARSTDVLTVVRGQESTTARSFATGDRIELRVTAQGLVDSSNIDLILPSQTSNSGKYLTTNGTASSWGTVDLTNLSATNLTSGTLATSRMAAGTIIKRSVHTNFTRQVLSIGATGTIYNFTFTKDKAFANSFLTVQARWTQYGSYSDFVGLYCVVVADDNSGTNDSSAFAGIGYSDNGEQNVGSLCKSFDSSSISTGSNTLRIGWRARNGDTGNRPGNVWNPDSNDDARQHTTGIYVIIDEIAK